MTVKRVRVDVSHTFDLDIPDDLLDEDSWDLSSFVYDAFIDEETRWDDVDFYFRDIKEIN